MLVDLECGDIHLQYGSPCIDVGRMDLLDADGSRSDMGACGGPVGTSYAYQDLPSQSPEAFAAESTPDNITLTWKKNTESDLYHYTLFRGSQLGVPLDSQHVLAYNRPSGQIMTKSEADTSQMIEYVDDSVEPMTDYVYSLVASDSSLFTSAPTDEIEFLYTQVNYDEIDNIDLSTSPVLFQNSPNPFNASTAISYYIHKMDAPLVPVRLDIYNMLGQRVRVLIDDLQMPGEHTIIWDGRDDVGNEVASGIYFYKLAAKAPAFSQSRKMLLLK